MLTFSLFALLATSLILLALVVRLTHQARVDDDYRDYLVQRIMNLESELLESYEHQADKDADICEYLTDIQSLMLSVHNYRELFETELAKNQDLEEELDTARKCIWDKANQLSNVKDLDIPF